MGVSRPSARRALSLLLLIAVAAVTGDPRAQAMEESESASVPLANTSQQWQSELFFHRQDGLYRAYDPTPGAMLPKPTIAGSDWPQAGAWQFSMSEIWNPYGGGDTGRWAYRTLAYDPGGPMYIQPDPISFHASGFNPGNQEMVADEPGWAVVTAYRGGPLNSAVLTYRAEGSFELRGIQYGQPMGELRLEDPYSSGRWTAGWTSIVPVDLNGDGDDEFLFYRATDGLFRIYDIRANGSLPSPISSGSYTTGWDSITAVDLDGDLQDEIMFYRRDGLFRYYDIGANGVLPKPLLAGNAYTTGWTSISRFEACRPDRTLCG